MKAAAFALVLVTAIQGQSLADRYNVSTVLISARKDPGFVECEKQHWPDTKECSLKARALVDLLGSLQRVRSGSPKR